MGQSKWMHLKNIFEAFKSYQPISEVSDGHEVSTVVITLPVFGYSAD